VLGHGASPLQVGEVPVRAPASASVTPPPPLAADPPKCIVLISSVAAKETYAGSSSYCASKWGLQVGGHSVFTIALSVLDGEWSVHLRHICLPGVGRAPMGSMRVLPRSASVRVSCSRAATDPLATPILAGAPLHGEHVALESRSSVEKLVVRALGCLESGMSAPYDPCPVHAPPLPALVPTSLFDEKAPGFRTPHLLRA
jgi:NAD(P)-dependent dehydrogenase (short-subunit alcohol dehydrogenase family)